MAQDGTGELIHGARADDGGGHSCVVQHPGEADVGGMFAKVAAEVFPLLDLRPVLLDALLHGFAGAATLLVHLFQHAAEHAAGQRAPRNHAEAIFAAGGQHFHFDVRLNRL